MFGNIRITTNIKNYIKIVSRKEIKNGEYFKVRKGRKILWK